MRFLRVGITLPLCPPAAASAAASLWYIFILGTGLRAGYGAGVCTDVGAWTPWLAYGAGSLAGGTSGAGVVADGSTILDAVAACKSPSAIGRGTKWSVAGEAVWCVGAGGLRRDNGLETSGSRPPTETGSVGGQTASPAWAGTAQRSERGMDVDAGDDGPREQALSYEQSDYPTTLIRGCQHSLWPAARLFAGGVSRNKKMGWRTLSVPAAGTAASWLPGTLLAGFTPAEVWRNSGQVRRRRSRTLEERCQRWAGQLVWTADLWCRADPQLRCIRRQDARGALR